MLFSESKQALARKLHADYADIGNNDLFSDADLGEAINFGVMRAWDYKRWPFTTKTKTVTTIDTTYYDQPTDLMPGSIFCLVIGDKVFTDPLRFEDYLKYKEDYPTGDDKKWSMHENFLFVNKHAYSIGATMDMIGKKFPPYLSDPAHLLPFSPTTDNYEHSGNQAIIELAYADILGSEKLKKHSESEIHEKKAYRILDLLWKPFAEQGTLQQSKKSSYSMPDYFGTGSRGSSPIGNF